MERFCFFLALAIGFIGCKENDGVRRFTEEIPFKNATHYWPLNYYDGKGLLEDKRGRSQAQLHNGAKLATTEQLDNVLELDGVDDWVDIKNLQDSCITELTCVGGLSVGFWLSFTSGDYLLAAGGYAGSAMGPPGFRMQRDWKTQVYKLEVGSRDRVWELFISKFPSYWVYFSFSWTPEAGIAVYMNGELKLKQDQATVLARSKQYKGDVIRSMVIAKADRLRRLQHYGKFKIGHLSVWKNALSEKEMRKAYQAVILVTPQTQICCYFLKEEELVKRPCLRVKEPERWEKLKNDHLSRCICPELQLGHCDDDEAFMDMAIVESKKASENAPMVGAVQDLSGSPRCQDTSSACSRIAQQQGYCLLAREQIDFTCPASCHFCDPLKSSRSSQPRFSQETLIFALCGCVGGIILLLGVTLYFWKAYRTRYTGAFVPPIKTVSLLDESEYDDRWPKKYIDSAAFQIKDVPPKKRALPIIPARTSQTAKYQPPEFD